MEPLFENTCFYTKDHLFQMARRTMNRLYVVYCSAVLCLSVLLGAVGFFLGGSWLWVGVVLWVAAAFLGYSLYSAPRRSARNNLRRNEELYHCEVETRLSFFEDHLTGYNLQSKSEIDLSYDRLARVTESEDLYLLLFPQKLVVMVAKNGFTAGAVGDFLPFLRARCPGARFPRG